jgi:lipopolysaccharide transport system permease protein
MRFSPSSTSSARFPIRCGRPLDLQQVSPRTHPVLRLLGLALRAVSCGAFYRAAAEASSTIAAVTETKVKVPREAPVEAPPPSVEAHLEADRREFVIRPAQRWPHLDVRELWHYRELLLRLVWRDIIVRYKQTFLGVAWALLVPVFTATVYIIVFGRFAKFPHGTTPYPVLVVAGVVPMQYFASAVTSSSTSLMSNLALVTKVYFPRVLLPLGAVIVPLVDLIVALPVMFTVMAIYHTWPNGWAGALAPLFIVLAVVTALGIGFLLATINVRWRDVPYMIPVFLQVLPLISGVMYALNQIPTKWQWLLSLNPMSTAIAGWRWAMLGEATPNWGQAAVSVSVSILLFTGGLAVFRSFEPRFADTI